MGKKAEKICSECGHFGIPKKVNPGGCAVELILWLLLLIPGIIYTVWRASSAYDVCSQCGGKDLLPITSPRGKKLMAEYHPQHARLDH